MSPPNFTLLDDAGGKFVLEGDQIKTAGLLDYEAQSSYQVTIGVEGATPAVLPQTLTINITDVFETSNLHLTGNSVSEAAEIGAIVGTLSVSNVQSGAPTFSLIDDAYGTFVLDADGITIKVADELDFETAEHHSIVVSVAGVIPPAPMTAFTISVLSIGPMPIAFSPVNGATGVAVNIVPTATFSVPVRRSTGYLYLKKVSDDSIVDIWMITTYPEYNNVPPGTEINPPCIELVGTINRFTTSLSGGGTNYSATMRMHPTTILSEGTEYYVTWEARVFKNEVGNMNPAFNGLTAWKFTTGGPPPATIVLSNTSIPATLTNGTLIGDLSVVGGSGTYTYTIPAMGDPDEIFCITGEDLGNRGSATVGEHRITIRAANGITAPIFQTFTITVTPAVIVPVNVTAPALSATNAIVGDLLNCTTGIWSNLAASFNYQWMRGGVDIGGATSSSYVVAAADASTTLTCKVRGVNSAGTAAYVTSSNSCAVGTALVLDAYSRGAVYSLRKIVTGYAGNCIKIQRSSDSTEQDFGFVSGVVDTAGIATFIGVGTGHVTVWYDQSGNGVHLAYQAGWPAGRPEFIAVGLNGKPTLRFISGGQWLYSSAIEASIISGSNQITAMVMHDPGPSGSEFSWGSTGSNLIRPTKSPGGAILYWEFGTTTAGAGGGQVEALTPTTYYVGGHIAEYHRTTGNVQGITIDGVSLVAATGLDDAPAAGPSSFWVGGSVIGGSGYDGDLYEVFLLKTDIGATARASVRTNMAGYYGVTFSVTAPVSLQYSGLDANPTLEDTVGTVPSQFNLLPWNKFSSCTNFYNRKEKWEEDTGNLLYYYDRLAPSGYVTGPFGSNNATRLIPTTLNGTHVISQALTRPFAVKSAIPWRLSFIAKPAGYSRLVFTWTLYNDLAADQFSIGANFSTGSIGYDSTVGANIVVDAATMTSIGSGWYLCKIDFHYPAVGDGNSIMASVTVDNGTGTAARSTTFTGDGTSGVDVFWWNLVPKAFWTINWSELLRDDFEDLSNIDLNNTKDPGYLWYVHFYFPNSFMPDFGWHTDPPSAPGKPGEYTIDRPSILRIYNYEVNSTWTCHLSTAVDTGDPDVYTSFAHKAPLIMENYFDQDTRLSSGVVGRGNYNTLWSVPLETLDNDMGFTAPGTEAQFWQEWTMEYHQNLVGGGILSWSTPYYANGYAYGPGAANLGASWPRKKFRRVAQLWLRAEDTGSDRGLFAVAVNGWIWGFVTYGPTVLPWPGTANFPPGSLTSGNVVGGVSGGDQHHRIVIMNSPANNADVHEPGFPYYVDWVRVLGVAP